MIRRLHLFIAFFSFISFTGFGQSTASDERPLLASSSLEGVWQGGFSVPGSGGELTFSLVALSEGNYFGTLSLPQQKLRRVPVQVRPLVGTDSVCLQVPSAQGWLRARRSVSGGELRGQWYQRGQARPVVLCYQELPATLRPQSRAALPYQEEEVTVPNALAHLSLAGTLSRPAGPGPFPAVVLVSDAGEQNRDGQAAGNPDDFRLLGALADNLVRQGLVVLRLDDRGVGNSEGRTSQTTPVQRAGDVQAALNYLRTRPEVDMLQLGLLGHGEGASVALLVAAQPLPPAFVVGLGAYGLTGYDTQLGQLEAQLQARRLPPAEQARQLRRQSTLYDLVRYSTNLPQTHSMVANLLRQGDANLTATAAQQQATALLTPWHRAFLTFNPLESLATVQCPVLLISGRADELAPPAAHLDNLERELRANGNRRVTTLRPAGVNHLLQPPQLAWTLLNGRLCPVLAPAVVAELGKWLATQVQAPPRTPSIQPPAPAGQFVLHQQP
jgi:pimeloyl-ACP methyl ester carboxylesterase